MAVNPLANTSESGRRSSILAIIQTFFVDFESLSHIPGMASGLLSGEHALQLFPNRSSQSA